MTIKVKVCNYLDIIPVYYAGTAVNKNSSFAILKKLFEHLNLLKIHTSALRKSVCVAKTRFAIIYLRTVTLKFGCLNAFDRCFKA